ALTCGFCCVGFQNTSCGHSSTIKDIGFAMLSRMNLALLSAGNDAATGRALKRLWVFRHVGLLAGREWRRSTAWRSAAKVERKRGLWRQQRQERGPVCQTGDPDK